LTFLTLALLADLGVLAVIVVAAAALRSKEDKGH